MSGVDSLQTKRASAVINGRPVDVVTLAFANKIQVSVWSKGKIGKVLSVQLFPDVVTVVGMQESTLESSDDTSLLPLPHLTPIPMMGVGPNDIQARLYATLISSIISRQSPEDTRKVVVCLGVDIGPQAEAEVTDNDRKELLEVVKLVEQCRVW